MTDRTLGADKYSRLLSALRRHGKLAIAFSGGVDSTLLLHAALEALGPDNVIAFYVRSPLIAEEAALVTHKVFAENFSHNTCLREIRVNPLSWQEFVVNGKNRCYVCKSKTYSFLQELANPDYSTLADGTNSDDQQEDRPGLRAIEELHVITPLADAGLVKNEIRGLAEKFGLTNFNRLSNSCLATRIPHSRPVTEETLRTIEQAEEFLQNRGFLGCRVRADTSFTLVEVLEKDIAAFVTPVNRSLVSDYFSGLQLAPVALYLKGR